MSRLIDADELMESIRKALGIKSMTKSLLLPAERTIIDQIDNAPTIGDWISVKDRLPNVAGWYLVFYNGSEMQVAFFKGKTWPFDNHYHKVTHWMLLPEPPKEE